MELGSLAREQKQCRCLWEVQGRENENCCMWGRKGGGEACVVLSWVCMAMFCSFSPGGAVRCAAEDAHRGALEENSTLDAVVDAVSGHHLSLSLAVCINKR